MIKKLRTKLVLSSMLSLFVVLSVILGIANILNYHNLLQEADHILQILAENDGTFSDSYKNSGTHIPADTLSPRDHRFSPELPYETRYFSVFMDNDGNIIASDTEKIAAVDTSSAIQYGQEVESRGRSSGFIDDYRYFVYTVDTETHIIFLDCGRNLDNFRTFMFISVVVSLAGLVAVFLLLIFLSSRIVKPFSENYEKQKRFITDAGHELKTPLTIIDADTEVLEMDFGENEWLRDIQTQTKRLADLTNSLISLARMEEGQSHMNVIEFPLSDIISETAETFQALAKTQNKSISCHIQPMLSMTGDEKTIRQLLSILLDNAVKYSNEGGQISLSLEKQKNQICLCVFNTADFISKESLPHLFDRFYRTDGSRNSSTGGYGLGLSIAATIVEAHKGKISATTQDEKSLSITAIFPG